MKVGKIEDGVELVRSKWAFLKSMVPGQSLLVEGIERTALSNAAVRNLGKGNYRIKKESTGFRVWRTK